MHCTPPPLANQTTGLPRPSPSGATGQVYASLSCRLPAWPAAVAVLGESRTDGSFLSVRQWRARDRPGTEWIADGARRVCTQSCLAACVV